MIEGEVIPMDNQWKSYKIRCKPRFIKSANCYRAYIMVKKYAISKSFSINNYGDNESALYEAIEWTRKKEIELGIARNLIRYLNQDTIEVKTGSKNKGEARFITDACNLDTIIKNTWTMDTLNYVYSSKSKLSFHREITNNKWPIVDHINGIPNDNRLCNLRDGSRGQNANNIKLFVTNTSGTNGLSWQEKGKLWLYRWCEGSIRHCECFTINNYGTKEKAESAAKERIKEVHAYLKKEYGIEKTTRTDQIKYKDIVRECKTKRKTDEWNAFLEKRYELRMKRQRTE